jgi:hypothetical protein
MRFNKRIAEEFAGIAQFGEISRRQSLCKRIYYSTGAPGVSGCRAFLGEIPVHINRETFESFVGFYSKRIKELASIGLVSYTWSINAHHAKN